jgi:hypothetical protein
VAKNPPAYDRVLREHRKRLYRISERRGVGDLRKMYVRTISQLENKLAAIPGAKRDRFTAHQHRLFLGQLRQGLALLTQRMTGVMGDISKDAQVDALRGLINSIGKLEAHFTGAEVVLPVEEAARFQGVIGGVRETMLRTHDVSMARYGARLITAMEDQLSVGLLAGEDIGTAIDRVVNTAGLEWYQAERIARTELIWAHNATQHQALRESARELPDMMMRWTENISDATGRALDDRVDGGRVEDSHAMHGQVAPAGGMFRFPNSMPGGGPIPAELNRFRGKSWAHPPNRPHDRASLTPVRPHWGVPGWQLIGGRRVPWP